MLYRILVLSVVSLICIQLVSANPQAHPDRPYRLIETRDGYSVEYSKGQEEYAEAAFNQMPKWIEHLDTSDREAAEFIVELQPMHFEDMRGRQEEITNMVAQVIGLQEPTQLMLDTYDSMVDQYEQKAIALSELSNDAREAFKSKEATVWQKPVIAELLKVGEEIPYFSYDGESEKVSFDGAYSSNGKIRSPHYRELERRITERGTNVTGNFGVNFKVDGKSGTWSEKSNFTKSVHLSNKSGVVGNRPIDEDNIAVPDVDSPREQQYMVLPIIITEENGDAPPEALVGSMLFKGFGSMLQVFMSYPRKPDGYHDPLSIHTVIHETAEVGLVENYLQSPDRRPALDGMAEYTTWKVIREVVGLELANKVHPLSSSMEKYRELQALLELKNWAASESQDEGEKGTDLNRARYVFSAASFFLIAQRFGDTTVTRIWQELGRLSKKKASLETFDLACKTVTGRSLFDFYEEVETRPVEELIGELNILREMSPPAPQPELVEKEIDGIPFVWDKRIPVSEEFLLSEVQKLRGKLADSLVKERFADQFLTDEKQVELYTLIKGWSRGRQVPRHNLEKFKANLHRIDVSKLNPEFSFRGIEFRDKSDTFTAMKAGETLRGLSFAGSPGEINVSPVTIAVKQKNISFRKQIIPVEGPNYSHIEIANAFQGIADKFESDMDFNSKKLMVTFVAQICQVISKHNFKSVGNDQSWFHEGFAYYVCYGALRKLMGPRELNVFWKQNFPYEGSYSISDPEWYLWEEDEPDKKRLLFYTFMAFQNLHNKHGNEMVAHWFDELDTNAEAIQQGEKTVHSILVELTGDSLNDLLAFKK